MKFTHFAIFLRRRRSAAFAQLPTQKMLTVDLAQTIAQEAMMKCRADGYKVSVTVVDHTNLLKAFLRDDGAPMATVEVARMKTNTVMAFGRPSGPPAEFAGRSTCAASAAAGHYQCHGRSSDQGWATNW